MTLKLNRNHSLNAGSYVELPSNIKNNKYYTNFENMYKNMLFKNVKTFEIRSFSNFKDYPRISINMYIFDADGYIRPMQICDICGAELEIDVLFYKKGNNSH